MSTPAFPSSTLPAPLLELQSFWHPRSGPLPFIRPGDAAGDAASKEQAAHLAAVQARIETLEREYARPLPPRVAAYVRLLPSRETCFTAVGNPIDLYGHPQLARHADGYNWNSVTRQPITTWGDSWLLIAQCGGDPYIIDLDHAARHPDAEPAILAAMHGAGRWDFAPVADSPAQFLLLAAAVQHALTAVLPEEEDPIIDDEHGFNLHPQAAQWLFPRMRQWAGGYYEDWVSVFENS